MVTLWTICPLYAVLSVRDTQHQSIAMTQTEENLHLFFSHWARRTSDLMGHRRLWKSYHLIQKEFRDLHPRIGQHHELQMLKKSYEWLKIPSRIKGNCQSEHPYKAIMHETQDESIMASTPPFSALYSGCLMGKNNIKRQRKNHHMFYWHLHNKEFTVCSKQPQSK